jgi:ABC transporter substrate binding protein
LNQIRHPVGIPDSAFSGTALSVAFPKVLLSVTMAHNVRHQDLPFASGFGALRKHVGRRHRPILTRMTRLKLPAIYYERFVVAEGGLMSYGPSLVDQFQRAAGYVDRILKGEKPADLPVQTPTKYELAINLKTAKALGLDVPQSLLARADEVIE